MEAIQIELYEQILSHGTWINEKDREAIIKVMEGLEEWYQETFEKLYIALNNADIGDSRMHSWMAFMHRPPFWRLHARQEHNKVLFVFAEYGLAITRTDPDKFRMIRILHPQRPYEDAGGAVVRQLRETFTYQYLLQIGIPHLYK